MTKIRLEAIVDNDASMFRWVDIIETVDVYLDEINSYLQETTDYWRPATITRTRDGGEFSFPNGNLVSIEWHTGKWYLETEEDLFPLRSSGSKEMAHEINDLITSSGFDVDLKQTELDFSAPQNQPLTF